MNPKWISSLSLNVKATPLLRTLPRPSDSCEEAPRHLPGPCVWHVFVDLLAHKCQGLQQDLYGLSEPKPYSRRTRRRIGVELTYLTYLRPQSGFKALPRSGH